MSQKSSEFDIYKLNRLPRRELPNAEPSEEELIAAIPFIFKPNRVAALHPEYKNKDKDCDGGIPHKDKYKRWAIKLNIDEIFTKDIYVAVVNRKGWLSIWHYLPNKENKENQYSGLFQVSLQSFEKRDDEQNESTLLAEQNFIYLASYLKEDELSERSPYHFDLMRLTQHCDEDGVVTLKLITNNYEYFVRLNFGLFKDTNQLSYSYIHKTLDKNAPKNIRQIGGWSSNKAFFWQDQDKESKLVFGSYHDPHPDKEKNFPNIPIRFWAAVKWESGNRKLTVVGGEGQQLFIKIDQEKYYKVLSDNTKIRGNIRSLTFLPQSQCDTFYPLILVGCDDFFLYILNHEGRLLQKVNIGGSVDALVYLDSKTKEWFDLVVLVRNRGLMCMRLFYDEFKFSDERKSSKKDKWEEFVEQLIGQKKEYLKNSLESDNSDKQLLAVAYLLYRLSAKQEVEQLITPEIISNLNGQVIIYLVHKIKAILRNCNYEKGYEPLMKTYAEIDIILCLKLTERIADSAYYARTLTRTLMEQLLWLKGNFSSRLRKDIEDATKKIVNRKHILQKCVQKTVEDNNDFFISKIISIQEYLKYGHNFNEVVVETINSLGQISGVCLLKNDEKDDSPSSNIYACYGINKLSAFHSIHEKEIEELTDESWEQSPNNYSFSQSPIVRQLIPIDSNHILIVAMDKIGLAKKGNEVRWHISSEIEKNKVFWTATYHNDTNLLFVGKESYSNEPIEVYIIRDNENHEKTIYRTADKLKLPNGWENRRVRITQLAWDKKGGLWATTGEKGELFYWTNVINQWKNQDIFAVKHLASTGHTQHALCVVEDKVLCGGYDGVLRAFDYTGQLLWSTVYPSPIRAITANQSEKNCADFAIATEKEYLFLCDDKGIQKGIFYMPGRFISSMTSGTVKNGSSQHHLVGTYRGEVRLIEEVPQDWQPKHYLENESDWQVVQEELANNIAHDKEKCQQWCSIKEAIKEPYRALWAAHQLIKKHQDSDTIFNLLSDNKVNDPFDPIVRELRAILLTLLSQNLNDVPNDKNHELYRLCERSQDIGFSKIILHLPVLNENKKGKRFLSRILKLAHKKICQGKLHVTSATLQRLRGESEQPKRDLEFFLTSALRDIKTFDDVTHSGYAESLLAILFNQMEVSKYGILGALLHLPQEYPRLTRFLNVRPKSEQKFLHWITLYSKTLFSEKDFRFWQSLVPMLKAKNISHIQIENILDEFKDFKQQKNVQLLMNYNTLLPHTKTQRSIDLVGEWQKCAELIKDLRVGILQIETYTMFNSSEWLEKQQNKLRSEKENVSLNLLKNFHTLLYESWIAELDRLCFRVTSPIDIYKDNINDEEFEPVQRLFRVLQTWNCTEASFYKVHHIPCCLGELEKLTSYGDLNISYDQILETIWGNFLVEDKPVRLLYNSLNDITIIPILVKNSLFNEKPLLHNYELKRSKHIPAAICIIPRKIFEQFNNEQKDVLLTIMSQINQRITNKYLEEQQKNYKILMQLEDRFFNNQSYNENGFVQAAKELTGAKGGLLATEHEQTRTLEIKVNMSEEHVDLNKENLRIEKSHHPIIKVWHSNEAIFIPDFQHSHYIEQLQNYSELKDWLQANKHTKSMVIVPVLSGSGYVNRKMGILLLHSEKMHFFTADKIALLELLLERNRWVLEVKQKMEYQEYWEGLFIHEFRSAVAPITQAINRALTKPTKAHESLQQIERYAYKAYDLSESFILAEKEPYINKNKQFQNPQKIVRHFLKLHEKAMEYAHQSYEINDLGNPDWHEVHLLGAKDAFERVIRVLLDNALKYGGQGADININATIHKEYWQLCIDNPGNMTAEENALKFTPFKVPKNRDASKPLGAHLGLAASRKIVVAYGGKLFLDNIEQYDEKRVQAKLYWPLAKEVSNDVSK